MWFVLVFVLFRCSVIWSLQVSSLKIIEIFGRISEHLCWCLHHTKALIVSGSRPKNTQSLCHKLTISHLQSHTFGVVLKLRHPENNHCLSKSNCPSPCKHPLCLSWHWFALITTICLSSAVSATTSNHWSSCYQVLCIQFLKLIQSVTALYQPGCSSSIWGQKAA